MNVTEIREKSRSVIDLIVSHVQYVMEKLVRIKSLDQGLREQEQLLLKIMMLGKR